MRFGSILTADAEGAVLGRPVRLSLGLLDLGHRLTADNLVSLREAGYTSVTAAFLEPHDIHRDDAAATLAEAVAGDGLRVGETRGGRCELFAEVRGVWIAPSSTIDAINCMDEAITVATVESRRLVERGDRVAAIAMVGLAVPEDPLAAAVSEGLASRVHVVPLRPMRAGLVLTTAESTDPTSFDRAGEAQLERLRALGCSIGRESRCDHDVPSLARAIESLLDDGLDPILVVGAAETVDRADIVPQAIETAGGIVDHFGVPVSPRGATLVAHRGPTMILGVPLGADRRGPSGFDDLLGQVVAGIEINSETIMRMGRGGLRVQRSDDP